MGSRQTGLALMVIVHWMDVSRLVTGACPSSVDEGLQQIQACFPRFIQVTDFTKTSASAIEAYCATGADQEVKCIDRFNDNCRRTTSEISRHFDEFVNPNGMREAIGVVCRTENIDTLISNMTCIGKQQQGVNRCAEDQLRRFKSQEFTTNEEAYDKGQKWLVQQERTMVCAYQVELKKCQSRYRQYCGDGIGDIFDALHTVTLPPMCGTVAIKQNVGSLLTAVLLSVIFIFRT